MVGWRNVILYRASSAAPRFLAPSLERFAGRLRIEKLTQPARKNFLVANFTFPNDENFPPHRVKGGDVCSVTLPVAFDLLWPVVAVCFRDSRSSPAIVAMPKTTVNEYGRLSSNKSNIRLSR